jgi:iron complex outermembrane receptor protein
MVRNRINAGLKFGYAKKSLFFRNALMLSLGVSNIFDKEFVSIINWTDGTRAGSTSYSIGAPFN